MKIYKNIFDRIVSPENLFSAWDAFKSDKRNKRDVLQFEWHLEENIFQLYRELKNKTYRHSHYTAFSICDPKPRRIHKAVVRDRVLHHAVFRVLYPIFDKGFIFDSYSCRLGKSTHRAISRLEKFCRRLSRNNCRSLFVLKCDVRKFFDSVDQNILLELIKKKVKDKDARRLIKRIIKSFESKSPASAGDSSAFSLRMTNGWKGRGLPLGNVTSQLFANIYLNELDQFIKRKLKARYYLRYCDDFLVLDTNEECLAGLVSVINNFLEQNLNLCLHSDKIIVRKYHQGIDFFGLCCFASLSGFTDENKKADI